MKLVNKVQVQQQGCCIEEVKSRSELPATIPLGNTKLEAFTLGYDELNLAEFPLSAIADRHPSGEKTKILTDSVWDRAAKKHLPRRLMISGTDLYGLPTAKDDDVLLACIQLSSIRGFDTSEVYFSRYEILKLLRWKDGTRNYQRLSTSLRRWLGVTIYSDRAFYDHENKSWVNRDFGVFDNLNIYERETDERGSASRRSSWRWNEVVLKSFQAGYLKRLDWELYCQLSSPVAKRLYRFLDKRFYHGDLVIGLEDLAIRKLRLSANYDTAQMKRALRKGIEELESKWELAPMGTKERFQKKGPGKWEVAFKRRRRQNSQRTAASITKHELVKEPASVTKLTKRGVSHMVARELVDKCDSDRIQSAIELFDWYNSHGNQKQPGFLVAAIRSDEPYAEPKGFESSSRRQARQQASNSRIRQERKIRVRTEQVRVTDAKRRSQVFFDFWDRLAPEEKVAFEQRACQAASPVKLDGYRRKAGTELGEEYRQVILREYFEKTQAAVDSAASGKPGSLSRSSGNSGNVS